MSKYTSTINWLRHESEVFTDNKYSRAHTWAFDSGQVINASSSPSVVPLPYSDEKAVDPEEAFLASLSSCHMLWFLGLAAKQGHIIDRYNDHAEAMMEKNIDHKVAITKVFLRPKVTFSNKVSEGEIMSLHHDAHEACFIANSVHSEIFIEPVFE